MDCIYNLETEKLYHIGKETSQFITKMIENGAEEELTEDEKETLAYLLKENLMAEDENKRKPLCNDINGAVSFAWIEVCDYCNLKCIHCYNESDYQKKKFMSLSIFEELCIQLKNSGIKKIQLIGGEPFCNPEIIEIIKMTKTYFEFVEIFTNGTMITEGTCQILKEYNIRICHGNSKGKKINEVLDESLRTLNKDKIDGCKDCEFRYACFDCRPDSIEKDCCSKPYYCTYDPQTANWKNADEFIIDFFEQYK